MTEIRWVQVTQDALESAKLEQAVRDTGAGAIVTFNGEVRDHDHGRTVTALHYEGHPTAEQVLREVAEQIAAAHDVIALAIAHRVGPVAIGEAAFVVSVSAAHRGEAFAACAAAVDLTKEKLPVWKHQWFADGTDEWVNFA